MKKLLLAVFATMFATATFAQTVNMGVSGTALYYDASGTETVKSSGTTNDKDDSGVAPVGSIFIETELDTGAVVGIDFVPYSAEVGSASNARTDTDTDDSSDTAGTNTVDVNFKNHVTLYIEAPIPNAFEGAFLKLGVSNVTLETDETVSTGSEYGDENLQGLTLGFGVKRDMPTGDGFYKIIGEISHFTGATFNSSNTANSIELDDFQTAAVRLSVGF